MPRGRSARGTRSRCRGPSPCAAQVEVEPAGDLLAQVSVTRSDADESWPPANQTTFTGVPFAAMPRALASAWPRPNSESWVPWISRVGASIRSSTPAGLLRSSTAAISGVSVPGGRGGLVGRADVGAEPAAGQRLLHGGGVERRRVDGRVERRAAAASRRRSRRRRPAPPRRVEQATAGGHRADAEEQARPTAACRRRRRRPAGWRRRSGVVDRAGLRREQRRRQGVPGDLRRDRVDAVVVGGAEQRQRAAVGAAGHADPRVAVVVELDVVPVGEQVDQRGEVGDLVARVVQPDLPGARARSRGRSR